MSDLYSTYDSANQYEVAFYACPTNFRIIQAKKRKAKSRGVHKVRENAQNPYIAMEFYKKHWREWKI